VAGFTAGIAGCSNSDGSGTTDDTEEETSEPGGNDSTTTAGAGESNTEDDDDDSTGTATPSSRDLGDPAGSVGEVAPAELSITGLDSHPGSQEETDGEWVTDVTAENTGDQETSLINYNYELVLTGEDGETLYDGLATIFGEGQAAAGESATVTIAVSSNADEEVAFEDVASYQVSLICASFVDSAYCE
jgi:hypothetical protein